MVPFEFIIQTYNALSKTFFFSIIQKFRYTLYIYSDEPVKQHHPIRRIE